MKPPAFALALILLVLATPLDDLLAAATADTEDDAVALENNQFLPPGRPVDSQPRPAGEPGVEDRSPATNDVSLPSSRLRPGATASVPVRPPLIYLFLSLRR